VARIDIAVTDVTRSGVALPAATTGVADGHMFLNDGNVIIQVANGDGAGAQVLTIQIPGLVDGLAVTARTVSIPLSSSKSIGPFPQSIYNQTDGKVYIDYPAGEHAHFATNVIRVP
jgi:hypothetical protein